MLSCSPASAPCSPKLPEALNVAPGGSGRVRSSPVTVAGTRGSGDAGEDVTVNVRTIRSLPLALRLPTAHDHDRGHGDPGDTRAPRGIDPAEFGWKFE